MENHSLLSQYSFSLPQKTLMVDSSITMDTSNPTNPILQQQPSSPSPFLQPPSLPSPLLAHELLINQLREVFPANIQSTSEELKFLSRDEFRNHAAQAFPFIQFKFGYILSQYTEPKKTNDDDDDDDDEEEKHQQRLRLYRLLKDTKKPNEETGKVNVSWAKVDDTLKNLPAPLRKNKKLITKNKKYQKVKKMTIATKISSSSSTKKANVIPIMTTVTKQREDHADTRLGFRFGNMFAVKRFFTFGERKTQPGEIHIIQTSEVPFLYYEVKEQYREQFQNAWDSRPDVRNGRFDPTDQKYFKAFVLNPDKYYMIPENTVYVILTAQKTLFALDRYNEEDFQKIIKEDKRWENIDLLSPNQNEQELVVIQVPIPTTNVITGSGGNNNNNKRKRKSSEFPSLDNEANWVYNDELKPSKIFINQNGGGVGGFQKEDIQFIPQYFYFEEPLPQQDQLTYQSGDGNIPPPPQPPPLEMIPSLNPSPPPPPSTPIYENEKVIPSLNTPPPPPPSPPIYQNDKYDFQTPSFYMDWDEIDFPILSPEQDQQQQLEFDNMLKELGNLYENNQTMDSVEATTTTTPPPVNDCSSSSLDELICNSPPPKHESLDELNSLLEEMNQYGLDLLIN